VEAVVLSAAGSGEVAEKVAGLGPTDSRLVYLHRFRVAAVEMAVAQTLPLLLLLPLPPLLRLVLQLHPRFLLLQVLL
jgi:hypothetical protein